MRHAFDSHNALGSLCDEVIYQMDLAERLRNAGLIPVATEVPVTVSHGDFSKTYYLDLVIDGCSIYELKAVVELAPVHEAQLLNYLFLLGISHGKLINFRAAKVQSRFVNTTLTGESRRQMTMDASRWIETDKESKCLRLTLIQLLEDWGGFLELPLYCEALTHFLGGETKVLQSLPLVRNGVVLGRQNFHMLTPDTAFRLSALPNGETLGFERHLHSLLEHTPLRRIQWLNMAKHEVHLATLEK
jgi:GxxExxY protein